MNCTSIDIIKIGGSVVTDKSSYLKVRKENLIKICKQLENWNKPLIVVHGAGSFGHIVAEKHSIQTGFKDIVQLNGIVKIRQDMSSLTQEVVSCLIENDVKAMGFQTSALAYSKDNEVLYFLKPVEKALSLGICPILSGDVLFVEKEGFTIHSGDSIINNLVKNFSVSQVIFLTDVDGLFEKTEDENARKLVRKLSYQDLVKFQAEKMKNDVIDVTGSMQGKIEEISKLLKHVEKVVILNGLFPKRLRFILNNEDVVSTTILGEKSTQR